MYLQIKNKTLFLIVLLVALVSCSQQEEEITRKLNDTGITWGGDYPKDINDDCSAELNAEQLSQFGDLEEGKTYEGDLIAYQDCSHGFDVQGEVKAPAFVYKKVDFKGEFLGDDAEVWTCVLDKVTGLLWEVKEGVDEEYASRGLHDGDDLFTWYNARPKENGGAVGDWNSRFDQCTGYTKGQPATYCNIEELVSRVNKHGYCGSQDWRVPTRVELESLVNFGVVRPTIDTDYFPYTKNKFYWTYTPVAGQPDTAWAVSFQFAYTAQLRRDNPQSVRLVTSWREQNAE